MPPVATVGDSGTLSFYGVGEDSGMRGGRHSQVEGSNPCPVHKSVCLRKELIVEDQDGSELLC